MNARPRFAFAAALLILGSTLAACGSNPAAPSVPPSSVPTASACAVLSGTTAMSAAVVNGSTCSTANSSVVLINRYDAGNNPLGACSGTVIASRAVLTAAHCVAGAASATIFLGSGAGIPAASMHASPGYRGLDPSSEDVGVILTSQDLGRRPFDLLVSRDAIAGERAVIAGWGLDQFGQGTTLRAATTNISGFTSTFLQTQYAGSGGNGGVCTGDSGGALLLFQGSAWAIAGVPAAISSSCTAAGTDYYANLRNPDIQAFIFGLVPSAGRR